eukprot:gene15098-6145_t
MGGRLANIAKNLVKLMTPERNEGAEGRQKAKPRGVDMAAERDKRKAQAQQQREKRTQNTLQNKRDPGKATESTGNGAAEVGDAGNGEANVQHEPTRSAEEGEAPPREPDEDDTKQQVEKVWKVGQKVWVRWEERKGDEMKFVKATIHAYSATGKSLSVWPEGAKQESAWIRWQQWKKELRPRGEEQTLEEDEDNVKRERAEQASSLEDPKQSPPQKR